MVIDMTPLVGVLSSLMGEASVSLEWSSIPRLSGSVMLLKIEEKKHNNASEQITLKEYKLVWRLLQL